MAKKRRTGAPRKPVPANTSFDIDETFNDPEDEFYTGRDQILLEEGPASKRRRKLEEQEIFLQPSDDEVLQYESEDADSLEDRSVGGDKGEDEEEGEIWGTSRSDYYDADALETEADALEEETEARRLQQKQLKAITEADFGFDDASWLDEKKPADRGRPVVEKLPNAEIPSNATEADKSAILQSRYPEFLPLAGDFQNLQKTWIELRKKADEESVKRGLTYSTKLHALSIYLGSIAMYFAVLTSVRNSPTDSLQITSILPNDLREHAVIGRLTSSRRLWDKVKDVEPIEMEQSARQTIAISKTNAVSTPKAVQKAKDMPRYENIKRTTERKKEHTTERAQQKSKRVDLQTLLSKTVGASDTDASDFGDEAPLTAEQAAEKAKRKKSLRFYSSQIVQKAGKRGAASREAGGDDDVPHKERLRERQERLLREAERRGRQQATADEELGGDDEDVVSGRDDEYYQSLVARSQKKKADKQAKSEAYAEAARQGGHVYEEEEVGPDGKRAITYAIQRNKGLMPKRKKDVRNPRVKKRNKYDEKKKKLGSIRQVYKGGEGRGGYGGELTGIKTNIVKSVKL